MRITSTTEEGHEESKDSNTNIDHLGFFSSLGERTIFCVSGNGKPSFSFFFCHSLFHRTFTEVPLMQL